MYYVVHAGTQTLMLIVFWYYCNTFMSFHSGVVKHFLFPKINSEFPVSMYHAQGIATIYL